MQFRVRDFLKAAGQISSGTMEGQAQGDQERQRLESERFNQALQANSLGYQREQDEHNRNVDYYKWLGSLPLDPDSKRKVAESAAGFFGKPQTSQYGLENLAPFAPKGSGFQLFNRSRPNAASSLPMPAANAPAGAAPTPTPGAAPSPMMPNFDLSQAGGGTPNRAGAGKPPPPPPVPASGPMAQSQMDIIQQIAPFLPGGGMIHRALQAATGPSADQMLTGQQPSIQDLMARGFPASALFPMGGALAGPGMGAPMSGQSPAAPSSTSLDTAPGQMPGAAPLMPNGQPRPAVPGPGLSHSFNAPGVGDLSMLGVDKAKAEKAMGRLDDQRKALRNLRIGDQATRQAVDNLISAMPNQIETPEEMQQAQNALDSGDRLLAGAGPAADTARRVRAKEDRESITKRTAALGTFKDPGAAAYELSDLLDEVDDYDRRYQGEAGLPKQIPANRAEIMKIRQWIDAGDADSLGKAEDLAQIVAGRMAAGLTPAQEGARLNTVTKLLSTLSLEALRNPKLVREKFAAAGLDHWAAMSDEALTQFGGARAEKMAMALMEQLPKWRTLAPAAQKLFTDQLRTFSRLSGRQISLSVKELNELDPKTRREILEDDREFNLKSMNAHTSRDQYLLARDKFNNAKEVARKKGLIKGDELKSGSVLSNLEQQSDLAYRNYLHVMESAGLVEGEFDLEHPEPGAEFETRKAYVAWKGAEERRNQFLRQKGVDVDDLSAATENRVPAVGPAPPPPAKKAKQPSGWDAVKAVGNKVVNSLTGGSPPAQASPPAAAPPASKPTGRYDFSKGQRSYRGVDKAKLRQTLLKGGMPESEVNKRFRGMFKD